MLLRGERHAEVDRQPFALVLRAKAVDRQIHADLADTAERRKHQFLVASLRHGQSLNTSPAVTVIRPPVVLSSKQPASSSPSNRPINSRSGSRTRISSPS